MFTKSYAYGVCVYKKNKNKTQILLCKSVKSLDKWGFLKGVAQKGETSKQTAVREFIEESSIIITQEMLEEYFIQINEDKDIGIYLVNWENIYNIDSYFINDTLYSRYLSWENSKVKLFDIDNLPPIKRKQIGIVNNIIKFLNKS